MSIDIDLFGNEIETDEPRPVATTPITEQTEHVVAFSGGLGSFEAARLIVGRYGIKNVSCVFTDTLTEDEDLYRFIDQTIAYLGCRYVRLCDGRDIWQVFTDVKFMGNSKVDPCSRVLKREIFKDYLKDKDPETTILYYGIGLHEKHRAARLQRRWAPYRIEYPLLAHGFNQEQTMAFLESVGIASPRLYDLGFPHNNCGGFCVKTGQRNMLHLLRMLPERYRWHEARQEELFTKIQPHGFIRHTTNTGVEYLSLKEFRERIENNAQPQLFNDGACECFV